MNNQLKGIIYITLSALFFGSYGIWSKLMATTFEGFTQGWTRGFIILLLLLPIGIYTKSYKGILRKDIVWFVLVCVGALNQAPYFYAFLHLDIGTSTLLFYAALTVTGYIMGKIFFSETLSIIKMLSLFLAIVGMLLLFGFSIQPTQLLAGLSAIMAGVMGGVEVTSTKKISNQYSNIQILTVLFMVMFAANLFLAALAREVIPTISLSIPWFAQLAYSLSTLGGMYFVVKGFRYTEVSIGSIVGLSEIIFAILFGILLFQESLTLVNVLGGILIVIASALPNIKK